MEVTVGTISIFRLNTAKTSILFETFDEGESLAVDEVDVDEKSHEKEI